MARSRRLALVLLPLLVAGAAACGGGGDEDSAAPSASASAADAELLAFGGGDMTAVPTCGTWLAASPWVRASAGAAFADGFSGDGTTLTGPEAQAGIDRECARLPVDAPFLRATMMVAMQEYDWEGALESAPGR